MKIKKCGDQLIPFLEEREREGEREKERGREGSLNKLSEVSAREGGQGRGTDLPLVGGWSIEREGSGHDACEQGALSCSLYFFNPSGHLLALYRCF